MLVWDTGTWTLLCTITALIGEYSATNFIGFQPIFFEPFHSSHPSSFFWLVYLEIRGP